MAQTGRKPQAILMMDTQGRTWRFESTSEAVDRAHVKFNTIKHCIESGRPHQIGSTLVFFDYALEV